MQNTNSKAINTKPQQLGKRKSIILVASGAAVLTHEKWVQPVAQSMTMPAHAQTSAMIVNLSSMLDGQQEVPAVVTDGTGMGTAELNTETGEINISISTSTLSGPIQAAHIHEGAAGVNGPVIVDLTSGINAAGDMVVITAMVPLDQIDAVLAGNTYFNIHTAAEPAGEIRGQLTM